MRTFLIILASFFVLGSKAQSHLPVGNAWGPGYLPWQPFPLYGAPSHLNGTQKWLLRPYTGFSAGYTFLNGGISYLSAPLGLTLYHPLTPNLTGFAGVSATPTVFSVGRLYNPYLLQQPFAGDAFSPGHGLGVNAAVGGGLLYTNDAHTFSISGSVWMSQSSYPVYPTTRRVNDSKQ